MKKPLVVITGASSEFGEATARLFAGLVDILCCCWLAELNG